ncbi:hypothetical protein OJ253_1748 [Cryptosporidium canis]|uniref:Uncharacterized protein n=1 Tax=Cryptosporidium canis TaxID=195482 RepID=A0A9D5HXG5_9CRYT|nr:hypothetical protein OJ253_1748 [Cryptosporidium canis]
MEENLSKLSSIKNTERTYSLKSVRSKKSVTIEDNLEKDDKQSLKEKYDGLTDTDDEKLIKHLSQKENVATMASTVNANNVADNQSPVLINRPAELESGNDDSLSSKESLSDESSEESDILSDENTYNDKSSGKIDIRELQPMETLSWLKNHGLNKMALIISKERENKLVERVKDDTVMGLYNSDIKKFKHGYLKNLFLSSLDKHTDKLNFDEDTIQSEQVETKKDNLNINNEVNTGRMHYQTYRLNDIANKSEIEKKYIKPKLINRLEISEEGISGENALAFQKYIRDLQEEVKMKDEKLKLREMERDNARLTRDQLTRAVKSSLEIGSGAGKLDNVIKDVIRRNLLYSFRILQYQARIELKGRLGSEIFAGASLIKQIVLKRMKFGFSQLIKNAISKKDEMFWKKPLVNSEDIAKNIISTFKSILSCYKLACIVQHNHISAIKKFLYIWTKCSNLKSEAAIESTFGAYSRTNGKTTLRELKTAADAKSKTLPKADRNRLNSGKKGFFSEDNFTKFKGNSSILGEDINAKEILDGINDTLSVIPDERLSHLTMLMDRSQEQKNIDISRNVALSHLAEVIKSSFETKNSRDFTNDALHKINNLHSDNKDKLISSFENLIFNKERIDIINEIRSHANEKYKQPICAPDWIKEKHSKLLEDFYSNPFYSIFVNEYNRRIFMDYQESSDESESSEDYQPEIDENGTESEYEVYYYSKESHDSNNFSIQKQKSGEIHIDSEKQDWNVSKADELYICDEADQFETVYYYDESCLENVGFDPEGNQVIYIDPCNISQDPKFGPGRTQTEIPYEQFSYDQAYGQIEESCEVENNVEPAELQLEIEENPGVIESPDNLDIENNNNSSNINEEEIVPYTDVADSEYTQNIV